MQRLQRTEIAHRQLQTAVELFLEGLDRSSVITLAGAASNVLDGLVRKAGKEPFVDYARRVHDQLVGGGTPKRQAYSHHIDKKLGVIAHKHLGSDDPDTVELDLDKQAADALARAIADYTTLYGQDEAFVKAYLQWAWVNTDGPAQMEAFKSVPAKLRQQDR
jgi:hypothetical protein